MEIGTLVRELLKYGKTKGLISEEDESYTASRLMEILSLSSLDGDEPMRHRELSEILSDICDYAYSAGLFESNSVVYRDLFDTKVMGALTPVPSAVIRNFKADYEKAPELATDNYYRLCCDTNYIRTDRIKRDLKWKAASEYGEIDIR